MKPKAKHLISVLVEKIKKNEEESVKFLRRFLSSFHVISNNSKREAPLRFMSNFNWK